MAFKSVHVKKYTCDNCHYFFYLTDEEDIPTNCPYCNREILPFEIVTFEPILVKNWF